MMNKIYKKIIVFGSTGFFGKNLKAITRGKNFKLININRKIFINLDKSKKLALLNKASFIFHFANQNNEHKANQYPINDLKDNLFLTISILETLRYCKSKPFLIYPSTVSLYKSSKILKTEKSKIDIISTYNAHKFINETYINFYSKKYKINSIILRVANVYGFNINNKRGLLQRMINDYLNNKNITLYNSGNQIRDYLHIDDLNSAFKKIITRPKAGLFNLCSGKSYSFIELDKIIRNILLNKFNFKNSSKIIFRKNNNDLFRRHFKGSNKKFRSNFLWKSKINLKKGITLIVKKTMN